ncbi:TrkH family potassium uptake protein [Treponema sp.]|uniref:TrkH family potassium uptake protein n=1 Tax=Treponema sp. TaxID=166 RepID=UPI00298D738E|nr:TrkH family potassium uptake protein [Treponema sp.]MCR5614248.1 TrkH family potassium uptake protein [Treponema sp.]
MAVINFFKIIFAILAIVATTYLIPIIVALSCGESAMIAPFAIPMVIAWLAFFVIYIFTRKQPIKLTIKSTFVIVAFAWISCSLFGAIPFLLSGYFPTVTDAIFESVSGFTTTGATILSDVECLPRSLNLWRCETHWLGGMGIVALTVALFPLLGVGGFQLIKAETTGPEKGKVTPKITTTAKALWFIYFVFTLVLFILLKIAGMDVIDALSHAFSTLGSGGFSTKNGSIGQYGSASIDWIVTVFMFLAGINFSLYFYFITGKFSEIRKNSEFRAYLGIVLIAILAITLFILPQNGGFFSALRYAAFQVTSIISTTGYSTCDYTTWIPAAQFFIFVLFFIGGSSGSTGGGVKVVRWVILEKQLKNEMLKMLHPHGIFSIRLNQKPGRKDVVYSVAAFLMCYFFVILLTTFAGTIANLDIFTAFTGAVSMIGNVGPAFGNLGPSFTSGSLATGLKWVYMFTMLAGRLELYTIVIFVMSDFWKK